MAEEIKQPMDEQMTQAEEIETTESSEEKKPKKERTALLYIQTTKNNTILILTDMAGNSLSRSSGGQNTKQARLKSSPTIAMFAAKKISEDAKELGITTLYVRIKGQAGETSTSSAAHAIIKSLSRDDFKVLSIMETTKSPRGGPKMGGGRRGRRV
jgi:ribosomal protein S11